MAAFLVLQAARFGDVVQTGRLLHGLAARGQVHLAVDESLVALARLLYPFACVHGLRLHGCNEQEILAKNRPALAQWRHENFSAVYNCNFSGLTAALCRIFEPEQVHGYRAAPGGIWRSPWARMAFRLSERRVISPLNLVDFWAFFAPSPLPPQQLNPVAAPGGQGLGVVLAGRESRRSLPMPLLAGVVGTAFSALGGPRVLLFGTAAEQPAARRLLRLLPAKMQDRVEDLSGKTGWPGLVDAVRGLDAIITPDTGTMHLAARLGVPVLAFFLSSALAHETGPYGQGHFVWQAWRACAPCLETAPCPYDVACLEPFRSQELLRSLTLALTGNTGRIANAGSFGSAGRAALPTGLQLWRSHVDSLGTVLRLEAGEDPHASGRKQVREYLASFLRLPLLEAVDAPFGQAMAGEEAASPCGVAGDGDIDQWLCGDADWMLPPQRYC